MPAPVMVVIVAAAVVITVTMVAVVMVQMMAAAEYQTRHYGYYEHFEKVLIHYWNDRGLCLFICLARH